MSLIWIFMLPLLVLLEKLLPAGAKNREINWGLLFVWAVATLLMYHVPNRRLDRLTA